jgi:hypothetical protein
MTDTLMGAALCAAHDLLHLHLNQEAIAPFKNPSLHQQKFVFFFSLTDGAVLLKVLYTDWAVLR